MNKKYVLIDIDLTLCETPHFATLEQFHEANHYAFKPKYNVISEIESLIEDGYFPMFITARCETLTHVTHSWLLKHVNFLLLERSKFSLVMRPENNKQESYKLKLDALQQRKITSENVHMWIDDDEVTLVEAKKAGYNIIHPNLIEEGLWNRN